MGMMQISRRGFAFQATLALAVVATPLDARSRAARTEAGLLGAEDARVKAQIAGDIVIVARGLADELIYSHGIGTTQTKAQLLAALRAGGNQGSAIEFSGRTAQIYGRAGLIRGSRLQRNGDRVMADTYLGVYVYRDGRWQLSAWQTTPAPSN
jgi:hypothetical protein